MPGLALGGCPQRTCRDPQMRPGPGDACAPWAHPACWAWPRRHVEGSLNPRSDPRPTAVPKSPSGSPRTALQGALIGIPNERLSASGLAHWIARRRRSACGGRRAARAPTAGRATASHPWTTEPLAISDNGCVLERLGGCKLDRWHGPRLIHYLHGRGSRMVMGELACAATRKRPCSPWPGVNQPVGRWPTGRKVALARPSPAGTYP